MTLPANFCDQLYEALSASGVHRYRSWQTAQFVTQCYDVLLSAHQALIQPTRWRQFCEKRGATTKRRKASAAAVPSNISETAITADLSMEAQRLLEEGGGADPLVPGIGIACVIADLTAPSDVSTGSSSKRPDLVFVPSSPSLQLQFAMEAKVVRMAAGIAGDLLGDDGFGCFVRAIDPYESNGVVGLMGYVDPTMAHAMTIEAERCMQADPRFRDVMASEFLVNSVGSSHQPRMVLGHIALARPKICVANMLPIELTSA